MRGFTKAAALLSSAVASAFVVPDTLTSGVGVEASIPRIEYHASEAFLSFNLDNLRLQGLEGEDLNLTLAVGELQSSDKPCGQSNLRFLGHSLPSTWDGNTAKGAQTLTQTQPSITTAWQILCLFENGPKESRNSHRAEVTQVLTLRIWQAGKDLDVGFTVSYTQAGQPQILRFNPHFTDLKSLESDAEYWRSPSTSKGLSETVDPEAAFSQPSNNRQKTSPGHVQALGQYIIKTFTAVKTTASKVFQSCRHHVKAFKAKVHEAMANLCPEKRKQALLAQSSTTITQLLPASPDRLIQAPTPAQTRSLHPTSTSSVLFDTLHSADAVPTPINPSTPSAHRLPASNNSPTNPLHFFKLLFIALTLFSLLTWLIIHIRDPRRRADRAARREERHNRTLYRRAAWAHWWQTRICALRHRHCPRSRGTGTSDTWDEKRARVFAQEGVLEAVCQEDIRHLRAATRPRRAGEGGTNSIAAAEEGRNTFPYDSDSEGGSSSPARRLRSTSGRSVSTLPGYESEGTQPPGYAGVEDMTPDSSVVSTSPRISRDGMGGLGSEDGLWAKDIERLDLGPGVVRRV